jgi:hypothetical protein
MPLIIFWGLIAKLTSVSGDCDVGKTEVEDFDWTKVGVRVLTGFLKQAPLKLVLGFLRISFVDQ